MTPTWEVRQGHVMDLLRAMPSESVHCIVTSPPYYGLRDYGLPPQVWGGDRACEHRWEEEKYRFRTTDEAYTEKSALTGNNYQHAPHGLLACGACGACGAWRGSLGLEPTPELFVQHLVGVLLECFRVLRADGTLWLNLGDTYSREGGEGARGTTSTLTARSPRSAAAQRRGMNGCRGLGISPKSLLGIPWRVALALQAAGAVLRSEIIWSKGNPMPESVRDRPTRAHEQLFLFAKGDPYFYDLAAIAEPVKVGYRGSSFSEGKTAEHQLGRASRASRAEHATRNKRSVWTVNTSPFPEAHFATFPPDLVRPCILAGTSERGCCSACGAPVVRVVERSFVPQEDVRDPAKLAKGSRKGLDASDGRADLPRGTTTTTTTGWRRSCDCDAGTEPCKVMDPFSGAATTGVVALQKGRSYVGLELNPDYVRMSERRLSKVAPLLTRRAEAAHG